jgi:hypothetical protein
MVCQPGTVSFNTTFHQRVSDVSIGESSVGTEMDPSCMSVIR